VLLREIITVCGENPAGTGAGVDGALSVHKAVLHAVFLWFALTALLSWDVLCVAHSCLTQKGLKEGERQTGHTHTHTPAHLQL
jgi:hypothetical protein